MSVQRVLGDTVAEARSASDAESGCGTGARPTSAVARTDGVQKGVARAAGTACILRRRRWTFVTSRFARCWTRCRDRLVVAWSGAEGRVSRGVSVVWRTRQTALLPDAGSQSGSVTRPRRTCYQHSDLLITVPDLYHRWFPSQWTCTAVPGSPYTRESSPR